VGNTFSFATAGLILLSTVLSTSNAKAASLVIPTTTINGTDVTSGPSFTLTSNFLGTDTISVDVSGTVDLRNGDYTVNAAGVLIQGSTSGPAGGVLAGPNSINFGALLLGNTTIGFRQLFPTNAGNGLGNSAPPTNLALTDVSLSSIFGSGLNSGTVLQFRVNDSDVANNSGAFTVSSPTAPPTTAVPEPFTIIGTLIGGTAAVRMRKKLKADKA
jgi:hypothetical protein